MAYYETIPDFTQPTYRLPARAVVFGLLMLFSLAAFGIVGGCQMGTPRIEIQKNAAGEWERVK